MKTLLKAHFDRHPAMEVGDGIKFLYQSHMGPGHLIADEEAALARLEAEWETAPAQPELPLFEPLGNGLCRLNLAPCRELGLSPRTLLRLFVLTAVEVIPDPKGLRDSLELVRSLPFPKEEVDRTLGDYLARGCPMVNHSAAYRAAYAPAYRVVSRFYVDLIPLLRAIDGQLAGGSPVRVALDGPCASGKSTLGGALARIYGCPLIPMDDFFLQPHQRTPERLAQTGGNVDYERFFREVLSPLTEGRPVRYRPWRCGEGNFGPEIVIPPSPLTVVEGVYSLRPDLREHYHLRVWVEAPWEARQQRLLERGGPGCLERFRQLWIPLEDRYFEACGVRECCHIALSGTNEA